MADEILKLGSIVHFVSDSGESDPENHRAAIVNRVSSLEKQIVDLTVFLTQFDHANIDPITGSSTKSRPRIGYDVAGIEYSEKPIVGTWHWPPEKE